MKDEDIDAFGTSPVLPGRRPCRDQAPWVAQESCQLSGGILMSASLDARGLDGTSGVVVVVSGGSRGRA